MKVKNLNSSSFKTKSLIKKTFIEMLGEKKELSKISVTELVKRANINRSTFYSHYNDIYGVVQDYENEIIDTFYNTWIYAEENNFEMFLDSLFTFMKENDQKLKMLCTSNEIFYSLAKLNELFKDQLIKKYRQSQGIISSKYLDLEINIFIDGMLYGYLKYCHDYSNYTIDDMHNYAKEWYHDFRKKHFIGA